MGMFHCGGDKGSVTVSESSSRSFGLGPYGEPRLGVNKGLMCPLLLAWKHFCASNRLCANFCRLSARDMRTLPDIATTMPMTSSIGKEGKSSISDQSRRQIIWGDGYTDGNMHRAPGSENARTSFWRRSDVWNGHMSPLLLPRSVFTFPSHASSPHTTLLIRISNSLGGICRPKLSCHWWWRWLIEKRYKEQAGVDPAQLPRAPELNQSYSGCTL